MRNAKRNVEGYAKVKRYGRAWLIIHNLSKPLSEVFGFEQTKREARKEIRELNARIAARAQSK
jgi:hypothetical protein